jgi:hypothetical protein
MGFNMGFSMGGALGVDREGGEGIGWLLFFSAAYRGVV